MGFREHTHLEWLAAHARNPAFHQCPGRPTIEPTVERRLLPTAPLPAPSFPSRRSTRRPPPPRTNLTTQWRRVHIAKASTVPVSKRAGTKASVTARCGDVQLSCT